MKLLIDTDAFCKLAVSDLLRASVHVLGMDFEDCRSLAALPHMLRRGSLPRRYGAVACEAMRQTAIALAKLPQASAEWLDPLARVEAIDPGEALIFAVAAESGVMILSGDKRALVALKDLEAHREALAGRIVVLEAILQTLCRDLGTDVVRKRVEPLVDLDQMVRSCFASEYSDPREGLRSYFNDLRKAVAPLILWDSSLGAPR